MLPDTPIGLLVFSAGGLRFGAYARQVAEVASAKEHSMLSEDGFFACVHNGETFQGIDFQHWLNQYAFPKPSDFGSGYVRPSKLLLITPSQECAYRAIWIDEIEAFLTASLDDLFTLPVFMQPMCQCSAVWGVVRHENAFILLIDLFKLHMPPNPWGAGTQVRNNVKKEIV